MIETAEVVAERYQITRDQEDEYSYQSQMRTAAGQASGIFDAEIVPLTVQEAASTTRRATRPRKRDRHHQ